MTTTSKRRRMTRTTLRRTVSAAAVVAVVVFAQVGLVLAPSQLDDNPLLVLALRPTPAFLVLVGDGVLPLTAVLVAAFGRTLVDVAYFSVARYGAGSVARRFGIGRALTGGVSGRRTTRGLLTVLFFWSSTPVIAAIGLGTTPARTFSLVTGAGNVVTSSVFVFFGRHFSGSLHGVTAWLSANAPAVTAALVGVVAAGTVVTLRKNRSAHGVVVAANGADTSEVAATGGRTADGGAAARAAAAVARRADPGREGGERASAPRAAGHRPGPHVHQGPAD